MVTRIIKDNRSLGCFRHGEDVVVYVGSVGKFDVV